MRRICKVHAASLCSSMTNCLHNCGINVKGFSTFAMHVIFLERHSSLELKIKFSVALWLRSAAFADLH